jgi:hypothetical protein
MRIITFLLLLFVLLPAACVGGCTLSNSTETSDGVREAKLLKLSTKGLFVKSHEGELGIFSTGEHGAVNPWEFTVRDTNLAQQLQAHVGCPVKLGYVEYLTANPVKFDSSYDVTWFECATHQGRCSK